MSFSPLSLLFLATSSLRHIRQNSAGVFLIFFLLLIGVWCSSGFFGGIWFWLFLVWFTLLFGWFLADLSQLMAWSILWWDRFRNWNLSKLVVASEVWVSGLSEWPCPDTAEILDFTNCPKDSGTFLSPSANDTETLSLAVPMASLFL